MRREAVPQGMAGGAFIQLGTQDGLLDGALKNGLVNVMPIGEKATRPEVGSGCRKDRPPAPVEFGVRVLAAQGAWYLDAHLGGQIPLVEGPHAIKVSMRIGPSESHPHIGLSALKLRPSPLLGDTA